MRNGLTCVQAVSRYLFGFYDGIPPPIGTRYHLPMDVLHSWASVKGAVERREMVAMSEGIASVFHIRHILYGETVPTEHRVRAKARSKGGSGRGGGRRTGAGTGRRGDSDIAQSLRPAPAL